MNEMVCHRSPYLNRSHQCQPTFFPCQFFSPLLLKLYMLGWLLGAVYSVPPLRTKRSPLLAAGTIALVRGFLLNFGVYHAVKEVSDGAVVAKGSEGPATFAPVCGRLFNTNR